MNNGILIWIVIFAVSTMGFFLIAAVVAVKGFFDLQLLLRHTNRSDKFEPNPGAKEETISD